MAIRPVPHPCINGYLGPQCVCPPNHCVEAKDIATIDTAALDRAVGQVITKHAIRTNTSIRFLRYRLLTEPLTNLTAVFVDDVRARYRQLIASQSSAKI